MAHAGDAQVSPRKRRSCLEPQMSNCARRAACEREEVMAMRGGKGNIEYRGAYAWRSGRAYPGLALW